LLTGRPPFKGESVALTLRMVEEEEPTPPRRLNAECDPDLEAVALKCLEKDTARRYETAGALAEDLRRWQAGEPVTARRAGTSRRLWKWVKRNPSVAALVAVCILILLGGAGLSSYYAVKASRQAKLTADEAERARVSAREATAASEQAKDSLCRGSFDQARALRLASQPGWRDRSLELVRKSAELRARTRADGGDPPDDAPTLAELRTEAVNSLLRADVRMAREFNAHLAFYAAHVSGDGRRLFQMHAEFAEPVRMYLLQIDTATGEELSRTDINLDFKDGKVNEESMSLVNIKALNGEGTRAVVVSAGTQVRELPTGRLVASLAEPPSDDKAPAPGFRPGISRDGSKVAVVRKAKKEAQVVAWDVARPDAPRIIARHELPAPPKDDGFAQFKDPGTFPGLAFTPDSKRLGFATGDRKFYRIMDMTVDPPKVAVDLPISEKFVNAHWHPTSPVLAITETTQNGRQRVVLWDVDRKAEIAVCGEDRAIAHEEEIPSWMAAAYPVAFSPNGQWLALGGSDPVIHIYGALDGAERLRMDLSGTFAGGVHALFWNHQNELVTAGLLQGIKVWSVELPTGSQTFPDVRPADRPAFSADGRWLAVFAPTGKLAADAKDRIGRLRGLGVLKDRVALIDRRSGKLVQYLPGNNDTGGRLFFSPGGERLVFERAGEILVRSVAAGDEVLRRAAGKGSPVWGWKNAFFEPGGRLLAFTIVDRGKAKEPKRTFVLWDLADDRPVPGFPEFSDSEFGVVQSAVASDGSRVLIEANPFGTMMKKDRETPPARLFDVPSGRPAGEFRLQSSGEPEVGGPIHLGPGGRRMLQLQIPFRKMTSGQATIRDVDWTVHELPSTEPILRIGNWSMTDHANDLSPDGRFVALGVEQGYVELWDVDARSLLFRWQPHGGKTVTHLTIAPNGDVATVAEGESGLTVLRLDEVRGKLTELGLGW
jgi:WD40 repeat protein